MSDFEIIGDEVHIYCVISLKNNSDDIKQVKLTGNFNKEADNGLLKFGTLNARFLETEKSISTKVRGDGGGCDALSN